MHFLQHPRSSLAGVIPGEDSEDAFVLHEVDLDGIDGALEIQVQVRVLVVAQIEVVIFDLLQNTAKKTCNKIYLQSTRA